MTNHPNRSRRTRREAETLARKSGCTLEYWRTGHAKHVTIYLPEGNTLDGIGDCDVLHHECELDEDIWPGVSQELRGLLP